MDKRAVVDWHTGAQGCEGGDMDRRRPYAVVAGGGVCGCSGEVGKPLSELCRVHVVNCDAVAQTKEDSGVAVISKDCLQDALSVFLGHKGGGSFVLCR